METFDLLLNISLGDSDVYHLKEKMIVYFKAIAYWSNH